MCKEYHSFLQNLEETRIQTMGMSHHRQRIDILNFCPSILASHVEKQQQNCDANKKEVILNRKYGDFSGQFLGKSLSPDLNSLITW